MAGAGTQAQALTDGPVDDLDDYLAAIRRWDPSQFTTAVDIVLAAYGDGSGS